MLIQFIQREDQNQNDSQSTYHIKNISTRVKYFNMKKA